MSSEADLFDNILQELANLPPSANPFQRIREIIVTSASLPQTTYVRPVLYTVAACYAVLSVAIAAALWERRRRKTLWLVKKAGLPTGTLYCPNGTAWFSIFFLIFYLSGQIYIWLFVASIAQSRKGNLTLYLQTPMLLVSFVPLYFSGFADMAGLVTSAVVAHCRDASSRIARVHVHVIHAILLFPPVATIIYFVAIFGKLGQALTAEVNAWSTVDTALANLAPTWSGTSAIEAIPELATLREPATVLGDCFENSVLWLRVLLASLAAALLFLCCFWLPIAFFQLFQVLKQLHMLKANKLQAARPRKRTEKRWSILSKASHDPAEILERRSRILVRLCWLRSASIIGLIGVTIYTSFFALDYAADPQATRDRPEKLIDWILGFHGFQLLTSGLSNIAFVWRSYTEGGNDQRVSVYLPPIEEEPDEKQLSTENPSPHLSY